MTVRVITVRFDLAAGVFDDTALVEHLDGRRLVSMSEQAWVVDGVPTMAFVVRSEAEAVAGQRARPASASGQRPEDALPEGVRRLFEALRTWRNARAKKDGRPAYVLFTNAQLAEIATRRPSTKEELHAIEGIGDARVRDYAGPVLQLIETLPAGDGDAASDS